MFGLFKSRRPQLTQATPERLEYLDRLNRSGICDMLMEAAAYLSNNESMQGGGLSDSEAQAVVVYWARERNSTNE